MTDVTNLPAQILDRAARVAAEMESYREDGISAAEMLFKNASITSAPEIVHRLFELNPASVSQSIIQTIARGFTR